MGRGEEAHQGADGPPHLQWLQPLKDYAEGITTVRLICDQGPAKVTREVALRRVNFARLRYRAFVAFVTTPAAAVEGEARRHPGRPRQRRALRGLRPDAVCQQQHSLRVCDLADVLHCSGGQDRAAGTFSRAVSVPARFTSAPPLKDASSSCLLQGSVDVDAILLKQAFDKARLQSVFLLLGA